LSNNKCTYLYINGKAKVLSAFALATCHEGVWGVEAYLHTLSTLETDVSASHLSYFTHRVKATGTHWIGGWDSSKTNVNALKTR
jgi:hypothetical protein